MFVTDGVMASGQQQVGSAPEDAWIPFIRAMYPSHLQEPHFFPPLFFNRVPHTVESVAGQIARVTVNPPAPPPRASRQQQRARRKLPPSPPPPPSSASSQPPASSSQSSSPAGVVFTDNPAGLQDEHIQDSDRQDDEAQFQCLQALRNIREAMMVVSQMKFRKYLDNEHNPQHHINPTNIISQLPSITHPSIPPQIADGECDIIIIHRRYGILVGEVKSVGGQYLTQQSPAVQDQIIARVVRKALAQLRNQEIALKHLLHDVAGGHIRVRKAVLLPNITSAQLTAAANTCQQLQQDLCQCTQSKSVPQAVSRCLCSDHLQQLLTWWSALWTVGPDPSMSDTVYERLLARFCGPASTINIPTAGHPCRVLRELGEAVAETALRFSSLVLTLDQVALLNEDPEPPYLYLYGPPGCGKTVVLLLKALQWAARGRNVVVVSQPVNAAVTVLVEEQLSRLLGSAAAAGAAGSVQRHCYDLDDADDDASHLAQLLGPGPVPESFILFDEVPEFGREIFPWLKAVRRELPNVSVWMAGLFRWDNAPRHPLPSWLQIRSLKEPLRCPPAVTGQVARLPVINDRRIPLYSAPVLPLPTEGPPARSLDHFRKDGHYGGEPWECESCADNIANILRELRVGQPGPPHYRDTWILCQYLPDVQSADVLVRRLRHHHNIPIRTVSQPPSEQDARDLALASTDQVIVTALDNVCGLERTVVIALGGVGHIQVQSWSRSTSFLCVIC